MSRCCYKPLMFLLISLNPVKLICLRTICLGNYSDLSQRNMELSALLICIVKHRHRMAGETFLENILWNRPLVKSHTG